MALIRQRYTPFGGAERFIERAIGGLESNGVSITLVTRSWSGERDAIIVDPPYFGRLWRDASFSRAVRALLAKERFDLEQSHERIPGCGVYRAGDGVHRQWLDHRLRSASLAERAGIRLNPYHWYVCAAERRMFEHPSLRAVICNSKMVAAEIAARFAVAAEKLRVIYNGVDLDQFHPERRAALRAESRGKLGIGEGQFVFGFVGSGFARKGVASAIDALAGCARRDLHLVVAGRDRASRSFQARAERAGLKARVHFVGAHPDVRFVYAASDCFILPTRYDPFPNAALEALAMGLPAIVSDQCGAAEIIEPGGNGWVCKPDEPSDLAQLMGQAADGRCASMGGAARATAERFGVDAMARRMLDLYESLLGPLAGAGKPQVNERMPETSPRQNA